MSESKNLVKAMPKQIVIAVEPQGMGAEKEIVEGINSFLKIKSILELRRASIEGKIKVDFLFRSGYISQDVYDLHQKYHNYCVSIEKHVTRYISMFSAPPPERLSVFSHADGRFMELKSKVV